MSVHVMSWVLRNSEEKLGRRLTLLVLADHADDQGEGAWPSVETIARESRLSERQARACLRGLEADESISQTGARPNGTRIYRVNMRAAETAPLPDDGGAESDREGGGIVPEGGAETAPEPSLEQPSKDPSLTSIARDERNLVRGTWLAQSPPLVAHRDSYFSETKTGKAIRKALDRYGTDDVLLAISAYAAVLESPDYYWTHRWTLLDFLNRGLDKFVPEARPLDNYRTEKKTDRRGDAVLSVADMRRQAAETLRREEDDRRRIEGAREPARRGLSDHSSRPGNL